MRLRWIEFNFIRNTSSSDPDKTVPDQWWLQWGIGTPPPPAENEKAFHICACAHI